MTLNPPRAQRRPTTRDFHGDQVIDDFEWFRAKDEDVLAHLRAENDYTTQVTAHQEGLREAIFNEIKTRTQETDVSVPSRRGKFWYYARTEEGQQYPIYCRVPVRGADDWTPPIPEIGVALPGEQIILDGNAEAQGKPFFSLGALSVHPDDRLMAFSQDNAGDERFTLRVKDLDTGTLLDDVIEGIFYDLSWSPRGDKLFYTVVDDSWRPHEIRVHVLGTPAESDVVLFREDDLGMWLNFEISSDQAEMLITASNSEYGETWSLDLWDDAASPRLLVSRELRLLHGIDPWDGRPLRSPEATTERLYVITHNAAGPNNAVSIASLDQLGDAADAARWRVLIPHRDAVKIDGAASTRTHVLISLRKDTTNRVALLPWNNLDQAVIEPSFDEAIATIGLSGAPYDGPSIRLGLTSFVTPPQAWEYHLETGALTLLKQQAVPGGFVRENYVASRDWARAEDGTLIPVSIIRRADVAPDGTNPCLVYGYGSYEISMDPDFALPRLSLLDRGVVFVIAHVRGGGELGRRWYEDGKKFNKINTFTDFIAVTKYVVDKGWADPARIGAHGGSAGGLLMGAICNLAPELYNVVVAQVPFVDALTTILNPDLPLSAMEWEEWGNPITDPDVYAYMKSYTPYENIRAEAYPRIAAVTSLNDTRVYFVEPAKWVQQLREITTGEEPIVLKTEMDGGHGGASGRYEQWKNRAWDYAFILDALGLNP